jgi:hypothetical protein
LLNQSVIEERTDFTVVDAVFAGEVDQNLLLDPLFVEVSLFHFLPQNGEKLFPVGVDQVEAGE